MALALTPRRPRRLRPTPDTRPYAPGGHEGRLVELRDLGQPAGHLGCRRRAWPARGHRRVGWFGQVCAALFHQRGLRRGAATMR
jgi:hypothetical protein